MLRDSYYDEPEPFYCRELGKVRRYTARKEHTLECGCVIKPGENYAAHAYDTENGFSYVKTHLGFCPKWGT